MASDRTTAAPAATQSEALRLAEKLERYGALHHEQAAAAELRRLHALTTAPAAPAATQPEAMARLLNEFQKLKARPDTANLRAFEGLLVVAAQDAALAAPAAQEAEPAAHPDDYAVDRFAAAMKDKLAAARAKGRGGWETAKCTQERLSTMLREHVEKGDPRDVANFCVFLWNRGERIGQPVVTAADGERYAAEFLKTKGYLPSIAQAYAAGTVRGGIASPCDASLLAAAPQAPAAVLAPADEMDWPLPCAVRVGHVTMAKGVRLRTLVARMQVLYDMCHGAAAPTQEAEDAAEGFDEWFYRRRIDAGSDVMPSDENKMRAAWAAARARQEGGGAA